MHQKKWRTHDLRHSFCYNALLKGKKMYQIQSILGHRSVQLTIDLYGHLKSISIDDPSPFDF
ncbi:MAG: tyrosine-type recombinase/integrase [Oligoflexia bacterium]|nr:tyrosine-type recombinase/integrase [Oligoflexia bacterium]